MPRRPRLMLANTPVHIIQRGNNRQACFFHEKDYRFYLDWLIEYAGQCQCSIHAYVLMTNHVHLLLTPKTKTSAGDLMKRLGQRYVQYINRTYKRSGTLWEGRFKSCLTREDSYVLSCYRYIELNPVRAGMVDHPGDYRWSSYRANGNGEASESLCPHQAYIALGPEEVSRREAYRALFRHHLEPGLVDKIRSSTNGNFVLGSEKFQKEVEFALGRRVIPGKSGRPRRSESSFEQNNLGGAV